MKVPDQPFWSRGSEVCRLLALTNNPKSINQFCYWAKISWENATDLEQCTEPTNAIHIMVLILLLTYTYMSVKSIRYHQVVNCTPLSRVERNGTHMMRYVFDFT